MVDLNVVCPPHVVAPVVRLGTGQGRWLLTATVLGSGLAGVDATVVNIALPTIGRDLGKDFGALQWTVTAYTRTLAAFILLGGSFGDQLGRRRIFLMGVGWFAAASLLCAVSPNGEFLIAARALQGFGGALVTPASLAIIQAVYAKEDRSRAIGAWAGFSGVATALAPFLGGWLIQVGSWRYIFVINLPLAVTVIWLSLRHVPETRDWRATGPLDLPGAFTGAVGLGAASYALITAPEAGVFSTRVLGALVVGSAAFVAFGVLEHGTPNPMLPLSLFTARQFSAVNGVTFLVYAAIGASLFLMVLELQVVSGFSPLVAGSALMPITLLVLLFSARSGALAQRIGPRLQMSLGPVVVGGGTLLALRLDQDSSYLADVLPVALAFGVGLAIMVAPLTSAALAGAPVEHAGIASGVNNAVARTANLLAIAAIPAVTGLGGTAYEDPDALLASFRDALWICLGLFCAGGAAAAVTVKGSTPGRGMTNRLVPRRHPRRPRTVHRPSRPGADADASTSQRPRPQGP